MLPKAAIYRTFLKTSPRFVALVTLSAVALECTGGGFVDFLWNRLNSGVSDLRYSTGIVLHTHTCVLETI